MERLCVAPRTLIEAPADPGLPFGRGVKWSEADRTAFIRCYSTLPQLDPSHLEEKLVVRITRPEAILTWMPNYEVGENHEDHQAAGVLATEAFDLAANAKFSGRSPIAI